MKQYKNLGDPVYIPKMEGSPLADKKQINFNYYLSTIIKGKNVDVDLTTKIFDKETEYICRVCYRVEIDQIGNCVKSCLVNHMCALGMNRKDIPKSLLT